MPGLTDIFNNGDDSTNSNSNDSNLLNNIEGDGNAALGLDATNSNSQQSTDDDGSSSSSSSDQTLGLDTSTDGLLHSVTDGFQSSDSDSSNS